MTEKKDLVKSEIIEPVTICDRFTIPVESCIITIRGLQVMVDKDLADLYGVSTKAMNQAVKRNLERFPESFRFQLTNSEKSAMMEQHNRLQTLKHSTVNPYVFTEQGVAMLSAVLKSNTAVRTSIRIMEAFVAMRSFIVNNASMFQRIERLEMQQLQMGDKIDEIFNKLSCKEIEKGIFFNGQIFDAYALIANIIRLAKKRIVVIDNYVDDTVLVQLSKRKPGVIVDIFDGQISKQLRLDVERHNQQYPGVSLHSYKKAHDRFLIIDEDVYHIGASLKDLGKKLFAFSKMDILTGSELLAAL